ncbi:MAG: aminotransferase class I/II-fold pyridoxal phosphate-dependent enzyme [Chlorobi bacterium]|nr:aminotransferase class I/II-fold pyridoxal phosphate-dependent enzyme [Chlorobiota bacterium]
MERRYKDKLPGIGTSIFAVMSGLARQTGAVNLSQGFPDFPVDGKLIESVHCAMREGHNQYAPMPGIAPLREELARKIKRFYDADYDPEDEITVTAGATQALFTVIQALVFPGDEVIVLEPAYDSYVPSVLLAGGRPVFVRLTKPNFHVDWDEVGRRITPRTKMIIVNTPNNPGGYVLDRSDWEELIRLTRNTNIVILSDEVYEHIVFDGLRHVSGMSFPELRDRLVAVFSFGKTFHATGWKTGYAVTDRPLTALIRKVHQFNVFSVNTPVQYGLAEYMAGYADYDEIARMYQAKRDLFIEGLEGSRWKVIPTKGTYFILLDYSDISDEPEFDFAVRLTKEYGVASIPLSSFYHDGYDQRCLRFCFAKKEETLRRATDILRRVG